MTYSIDELHNCYEDYLVELQKAKDASKQVEQQIVDIRKSEVLKVLNYLEFLIWDDAEIDRTQFGRCLLHCLYCLRGDIDGVFLPIRQVRQKDGTDKYVYGDEK